MPLNFKDFFPFTIYDHARIVPGYFPGFFAAPNLTLPLASLSKAYWRASSFDYNLNLAWTSGSFAGSVTGSGTASILTASGLSVSTARRVISPAFVNHHSSPDIIGPLALRVPLVYNWTSSGSHSGTGTFSSLAWFSSIYSAVSFPVMTFGAGLYRTLFNAEVSLPNGGLFAGSSVTTVNTNGALPFPCSASASITVDGVVSNSIPFYRDLTYDDVTGSLSLNFNSFLPI